MTNDPLITWTDKEPNIIIELKIHSRKNALRSFVEYKENDPEDLSTIISTTM